MQIWKQEVQYIGSTSLHVSHDPAFGLRGPLPPHWHEEVELDFVLNGSLIYIINGVSTKVSTGEIAVVNSGVVHFGLELDNAPRAEMLAVLLDRKLFEPYLGEQPPMFKTFLPESENEELRETDAPLSDIAFDCGFPSASSLITFFKRQYQTTPDRYRKLAQKGSAEKVKIS